MVILIFLLLEALGVLMVIYPFRIVRTFGTQSWAEKFFGPGGTYNAWRLYGLITIVFALVAWRYGFLEMMIKSKG